MRRLHDEEGAQDGAGGGTAREAARDVRGGGAEGEGGMGEGLGWVGWGELNFFGTSWGIQFLVLLCGFFGFSLGSGTFWLNYQVDRGGYTVMADRQAASAAVEEERG